MRQSPGWLMAGFHGGTAIDQNLPGKIAPSCLLRRLAVIRTQSEHASLLCAPSGLQADRLASKRQQLCAAIQNEPELEN